MLYDPKKFDTDTTDVVTIPVIFIEQPKPFLSAKQLRVAERTREAFIAVYDAMAKGLIPAEHFDMGCVGSVDWETSYCNTPACMVGWAMAYNAFVTSAYRGYDVHPPEGSGLYKLCYPRVRGAIQVRDLKIAQQALYNWLTTGYANWRKVMKSAK